MAKLPLPHPWLPGDQRPDSFEDKAQQNFDALAIAVGALRQHSGWTAVTAFSNSWVNFGGSYAVAAYKMTPDGTVHIKGTVKSGVGAVVFVLPAAYRPTEDRRMAGISYNGATNVAQQITVFSNGNVAVESGGTNEASLECSFQR